MYSEDEYYGNLYAKYDAQLAAASEAQEHISYLVDIKDALASLQSAIEAYDRSEYGGTLFSYLGSDDVSEAFKECKRAIDGLGGEI